MSDDLISRTALLRYIKDGLDNFPPFVDEYDKVDWIQIGRASCRERV